MAIYLFFGEESYLLETKVKKIKREFGNLVTGINFIQIDDIYSLSYRVYNDIEITEVWTTDRGFVGQ